MKIKFEVADLPETKNDKFIYHTEEREYPDEAVRDNIWCTVCGFNAYPECQKDCHSYELWKKQQSK